MKELILEAELRAPKSSKGLLSKLRAEEKIPAVVYGGTKESISIVVGTRALRKATKDGLNAIMTLRHPKGEDTVILKEVTHHVVTNQTIHVDFQRISLTEKITVKVSIKITGEAPGVKLQGGILEHVLREVDVKCLPTAIPHELTVDVSKLGITESLHVSDIKLSEGLEILQDAKQLVVNIVAPAAEEVAAPAEGAAAAEPELSAAKGKKDADGNVIAKEGAAPAADAKGKPAAGGKGDAKKEEKK